MEFCIKAGPTFTVAQVKALRDDTKLGDTLLVDGTADASDADVILPYRVLVTTRWKDRQPGQHFVPKCSPMKLPQCKPLRAAEKHLRNAKERDVQEDERTSNVSVSLMSTSYLYCILLALYPGIAGQHSV